MRISEWSSDVCSADLRGERHRAAFAAEERGSQPLFEFAHSCRYRRLRRVEPLGSGRKSAEPVDPQQGFEMIERDAIDRHLLCRSEEHTSELQSLMRNSYAVFCLKKKKKHNNHITINK